MQPTRTAVIVDDSPLMRAQLRRILEGAGFKVVAEAARAETLDALYDAHRTDVISLDIVMPGRDGATAAAALLGKFPEANIVMCSSLSSREKIVACQRVGVKYYLLKPFQPEHASKIFAAAATARQSAGAV